MPAPSRLQIATSSLERLLKEESSYHKELEQGQARIQRLETEPSNDENAEYMLRQEVDYPRFHPPTSITTNGLVEKSSRGDEGSLSIHAQTNQGCSSTAWTATGELTINTWHRRAYW